MFTPDLNLITTYWNAILFNSTQYILYSPTIHRRTQGPQTYARGPWLIVLVNLGYSFNDHA